LPTGLCEHTGYSVESVLHRMVILSATGATVTAGFTVSRHSTTDKVVTKVTVTISDSGFIARRMLI